MPDDKPAAPLEAGVPRVALLMFGLSDLQGGGGTERFFADVLDEHARHGPRRVRLTLLCDRGSLAKLRDVNRARAVTDVRVLPFDVARLSSWRAALALHRGNWLRDVDLLHIPLISPVYLPYLWSRWPCREGPPLTMTVVDANLAHVYRDRRARNSPERVKSYWLHRIYFESVRFDGLFTWYRKARDCLDAESLRGTPLVRAARYCFVDNTRFHADGAREKRVVFAARMVEGKRPLLFVEAIREALASQPALLREWQFHMYGRGHLESRVRECIRSSGLEGRITLRSAPDLAEVFARSSVFVSTQDFENFTSLSMLEAMACGNAVVARDVGQTAEFLRDGENGVMARSDDPAALAEALIRCIADPARLDAYARESRRIAVEEHCVGRFLDDIEGFWIDTLSRPMRGARP